MDMRKFSDYRSNFGALAGNENLAFLGNFNDNHDNPRFLNDLVGNLYKDEKQKVGIQEKYKMFQAITAFCLTNDGIPIIYYGTEQAFSGGNDP
jgi:alpha-amylase